jgi:hypothetical protein
LRPTISRRKQKRDAAIAQDALLVINVVEKVVEGRDPLGQPAFEHLPLGARDDARDQVEGEDALNALFLPVDREGDALIQKRRVCGAAALGQGGGRECLKLFEEVSVVFARATRSREHLVEEPFWVVAIRQHPV